MTSSELIDRLPFELQARLEADDYFQDVAVVVMEQGNVLREMARKQAAMTAKGGKRGVAVIVLQTIAEDQSSGNPFHPMTLFPSFQVVELVELNRDPQGTGKTARAVARRVRDVIRSCALRGLITDIYSDTPCIVPVPPEKDQVEKLVLYQVNFKCSESNTSLPAQCDDPVPVVSGDQLTLTCPTADAAIYYSLDLSYPAPGRDGAQLYSGPVTLTESGVLRAAAYLPGRLASHVIYVVVTPD